MSHYQPYSEYKDSGVEWIGKVPEHWQHSKVAWDMKMTIGWTPPTGKRSYYGGPHNWVSIADLSAGRVCNTKQTITDAAVSEMRGTQAPVGSLLFSYKLSLGEVALLEQPAFTNEAIAAFHPCKRVYMPFWKYAAPVILPRYSRENIYGSALLNQELMNSARMYLPEVVEQEAIANCLDRETSRIDALITKKTRFIELLKEKRQALITNAVTKGLDPEVKMKDSGIEWIGEVPEHWVVVQLGKIAITRCDGPFGSGLKSEHYQPDGVRVIRLQNIGWASFKDGDAAFISHEHWSDVLGFGHEVLPDDILIGGLGDDKNPLGRACVAPVNLGPALVKADCYRFRLRKDKAVPEFIALALSATARAECGYMATGATRDRLNLGLASARVVALPPRDEQHEIVSVLKRAVGRIDLLTDKTQHSIDLLKERRSALITAAVTGQIDLRESA